MTGPNDNPLLSPYTVPPLDRIRPEHYEPAIDRALAATEEKLAAIKAAPASFENTAMPLESLFDALDDICNLLRNAGQNTYSKELSAVESAISVRVSDFKNRVFQDRALGALFQSVYMQADQTSLNGDDQAVLRALYRAFESAGAFLDAAAQDRIRAIDAELIRLATTFNDNIQAAPLQQAVLITDAAELAGLSPDNIALLEKQARDNGHETGWLFVPERLLVGEWLERAAHPGFRRKMVESLARMGTATPHDNEPVIEKMHKLRHEYAALLGYKDYASFARTRTMKNLQEAQDLLRDVAAATLPQFENDMRELEAFAAANGGPATLEPWDVPYWAGRQRQDLYHFDANDFSRFLPLESVLQGMFSEAMAVGNLDYKESTGKYPVMHPEIRTFDVTDRETGVKTILHVDIYARPGTKGGGAWMDAIQAGGGGRPAIIALNMNIAKPPEGSQALVSLSQYETFYHENGHCLQGLAAQRSKYRSLNGVSGPSDFIEIHSMINEERGYVLENLVLHAIDAATGEQPDDAMLGALENSRSHFKARDILTIVQNSLRDLAFHMVSPGDYRGTKDLEARVAFGSPYMDHLRAYPLTRFTHLFSEARGAYCAAYVDYLVAQLHAADGFAMMSEDPYNPDDLKRLREFYNPRAGAPVDNYAERYRAYRGRDATPKAMLRQAGVKPPAPEG